MKTDLSKKSDYMNPPGVVYANAGQKKKQGNSRALVALNCERHAHTHSTVLNYSALTALYYLPYFFFFFTSIVQKGSC